eukprot:9382379-Alexandrium_andersonii.AAC.1
MSASLVGSEMCIRDSPTAARPAEGEELYGDRPPPRSPHRRAWAKRSGAVSYTHLTLPTICSV